MRFLSACLLAFALLASAFFSPPSSATDRFDHDIKAAVGKYLPGLDWRLLKAQYYQESRLDPMAVSPVGAMGVAQFMPGTWADVSRDLRFSGVEAFEARFAIEGGAYYMAKLRRSWSSPRPEADRHSLAMASYNAGLGNILKAQKLCDGRLLYHEITPCLPQVTGPYSNETTTYVRRIWGYYTSMLIGGVP